VSSVLDQRIVRLRKYGEQLTCAEIARELGVPETRVHSALRRNGLQRQYRGMDRRSRQAAPLSPVEPRP
jgi:DNA-directed RNA polymerase specialized sigma24 family protein